MKANEKQIEACHIISDQVSFWEHTNDITSSTHFCDIEESVNMSEVLSESESAELTTLLILLYKFVKHLS